MLMFLCLLLQFLQATDDQRTAVDAELDANAKPRSRLLIERRSRRDASNHDYGATKDCVVINVKNNTNIYNESKQSICGSDNGTLKVSRDVFKHIWKFIEDKRSVSRSNHALDIHRLSVDASFQRVFELLLTSELQRKLYQAPVFRQVSIANNTVSILQRNKTLKALEQQKFIRGIDECDRPFIIFSLSPSNQIPTFPCYADKLYARYAFLQRQNILIIFNETGIYSSSHQFTMNEFIHLLEYDEVMKPIVTSLGIVHGTNQKWIHTADLISRKQRIFQNLDIINAIKWIKTLLILAAQFYLVLHYTRSGSDSLYHSLSIFASTALGVLVGFVVGFVYSGLCPKADRLTQNFCCEALFCIITATLSGYGAHHLATSSVALNGLMSGVFGAAAWCIPLSYFMGF